MYDVVVVGGGPAGLSAAVQARTRNKSVLVVSGDVRDNPLWKARLVNNYLDPEGIFLFDMNTPYKYRELLGDNTIAENRENCSFIWENTFYEEEGINEYDLTIFVEEADRRYRKYQETHLQRSYEPERVEKLLKDAGLEVLGVYDAFTKEPPRADSERLCFIAREKGKAGKQ